MIIIHVVNELFLSRLLAPAIERGLRALPIVVITGARQTGKSTLVRRLGSPERRYLTLDDLDVRAQAEKAPQDLVRRAPRLILDEVQRVPDLLIAVKQVVDEKRRRGQFILTGSANLLLMKRVSESLAGRAVYLTLWPFTRRERLGLGRGGIWDQLFNNPFEQWPDLLKDQSIQTEDWRQAVLQGGYPVPALELQQPEERSLWLDGYVRTYLERDLQELSSIDALVDFRRLMGAVCLRLGQLTNQTELGRDVRLPQPTVHRWLNLLETSYQLVRVPAYAVNRTKRLIKTPKLYWADTALAMHLAGETEPRGPHLENLILGDVLAWRDSAAVRPEVYYWRTAVGEEVDFVLESRRRLIAIEVKATARPRAADSVHLRTFREEYGKTVQGALLLHTGDSIEVLGPRILAAPWWRVI